MTIRKEFDQLQFSAELWADTATCRYLVGPLLADGFPLFAFISARSWERKSDRGHPNGCPTVGPTTYRQTNHCPIAGRACLPSNGPLGAPNSGPIFIPTENGIIFE